ncbi:Sucrose phosphorylase (Glucosyltransferase-A) [Candidatus Phytoplasma australiense]|uniref:Sucrose phosphorylase (Glucosyltransferase-A) n=1 Tax=Phytoplasma australiense TaxID=59748 RepID=B1V9C4_PHYAS|nr:Sucrose phosphorylase (Glucosyltransferase-A) [Candidatus Phytoplasma australiense]
MKIKNKVMLITYPDSLGKNISDLIKVLKEDIGNDVIGGVHLLPFFPSTSDRGFAPSDYNLVDPAFGDWKDIEELGKQYYLMFDFMINHISRASVMYQDFKKNHELSKYSNFFIRWENFWLKAGQNRPTQEDIDLIYKRKDKEPNQLIKFDNGQKEHLWNTFGEDQIDININDDIAKEFIKKTLEFMVKKGASLIRLDAFAYVCKKAGTNCFFLEPEIWDLLHGVSEILKPLGACILPEIHEQYSISHKISEQGYFIYDFALPLVVLFTMYSGKTHRLKEWLAKSPMKQFTTLDTHDGIGVVDALDILTEDEINYTSKRIYKIGVNAKKIYSTKAYKNLDIYQINSTYYSALGNEDDTYLLSRAFQIFAPGIPQIYYVGLLAGENDIKLLEATKEGRNINRHYYSREEIKAEVKRQVVVDLFKLLKWRNECQAFDLDGSIFVDPTLENHKIKILRQDKSGQNKAVLEADVVSKKFIITHNGKEIFKN